MHITYRKIVGEQMSPAPPLLSRLMYSARLQNREVYYLLFDCIALQIPDAPYSGMLASLRLGLDSHSSLNRLSIARPSRGQARPMALLLAPIPRLRTGPEIITNRVWFPCSSAWVVYLRTYGAHVFEQNSPATSLRCSWHLTCYFLRYHSSMTFGNLA
jgi:hypothetical protein